LAHGEVGTAQSVTRIGQKKFLERWRSNIFAHQIMQLLTPEAQIAKLKSTRKSINELTLYPTRQLMMAVHLSMKFLS
jgi:hypothetical protein